MKDVVLDEVKNKEGNFEKLLTKICIDFKIDNYREVVKRFLEYNKRIKNQPFFSHLVLNNYKKVKRTKKTNIDFMLFTEE